jgi:chemotaxis protein MotB
MRRKKKNVEEPADEKWLIPYADMLTLLLALFIVMFATSNVDNQKLQKMGREFQVIFSGGTAILEQGGSSSQPLENQDVTNSIIEDAKMDAIKKNLETEIEKRGYSDKINVTLNNVGLDISMQDVVLFNSGEADVIEGQELLIQISHILNGLDNSIMIVGHTDNVPIKNSKFRSNWDLSAIRAINVMNFMSENGGLNTKNICIQAYGDRMPLYNNSTEAGRSKDRRVEIEIVRKYPKVLSENK